MRSAPAAATSATCSPSREKSADRMEGAMNMVSSAFGFRVPSYTQSAVSGRVRQVASHNNLKLGTGNLKLHRMSYRFPIARKILALAGRARRNWLVRHQTPANFWIHMLGIPLAFAGVPLLFVAEWYWGV